MHWKNEAREQTVLQGRVSATILHDAGRSGAISLFQSCGS